MTRNLAILTFDDVEVLDFCGPFEVFSVTGQRGVRPSGGEYPFNVYTVAEQAGPALARNGLSVNPTWTIENCPQPDILLVPGGRGTRSQLTNANIIHWIQQQAERVELLLAKADLLHGLNATTHFGAVEELRALAPDTRICPDERYVDNGKIILSAGISAGIDMSFYVVARLLGKEQANETARYMQYDYWHM